MENVSEIQPSDPDVVISVESARRAGVSAVSSPPVPHQPYCRQVSVEDRETYLELYHAAKAGSWKAAKRILDSDRSNLLRADLTNWKETILHVATQANQAKFVMQLLEYVDEHERSEYLELLDVDENTAFLLAVASDHMKIVHLMGEKHPGLRTKAGYHPQLTPLHMAVMQGKREMAWHLFKKTIGFEYGYEGLKSLLFQCVNAGIYDLALELLKKKSDLAFERDPANETALHILSRKPLDWKEIGRYELTSFLWKDIFLGLPDKEIIENIGGASHILFNAIKAGNSFFLELLINSYPYFIWQVDERNRSIIHLAVLNRQSYIFNFTLHISSIKYIILNYIDTHDGNNLLHMAATLPSRGQLNLVSGAAFQMTLELIWFEEVKKIVPPSFIEMKNADGLTPHELFTVEHKKLTDEARSWTEKTTNCCMVVSTLITTGVITATYCIPGGMGDDGSPLYLVDQKMWFVIFSIFNAIAMISSSTSIIIFFSILISRHAEYDFRYKSLPMKLIFGLVSLLISMVSMMISFSSAFIMYFNTKTLSHGPHHNGLEWVPIFISVLASIPIPIFAYLLWPLWSDIARLNEFSRNLSWPMKKSWY